MVGNFIASLSVASTITLSPKRSSLVVSNIPKSLSLLLNKPVNQSPIPMNHSLIESIKEDAPPLPDMRQEKVFKFYYEHYNKEYNVVFSKKVMRDLAMLNDKICDEILFFLNNIL